MLPTEIILNALVNVGAIGAWEIEYDGALFIRGYVPVEDVENEMTETWSVTIMPNGEVVE